MKKIVIVTEKDEKNIEKIMQCFRPGLELNASMIATQTCMSYTFCHGVLAKLVALGEITVEKYKRGDKGTYSHVYRKSKNSKQPAQYPPETVVANKSYAKALSQTDMGGVTAMSAEALGKGHYVPAVNVNYTPRKVRFFTG